MNRSKRRFQTHLLVYAFLVLMLATFNGLDAAWLPAAGLWLIAVIMHGFAAYQLGPFSRAD
jgi:hypothetical protein